MLSTQITDPRERLVTVGNKLLDSIYELEATEAAWKELEAAKGDQEKLGELMKGDGVEVLIKRLEIIGKRDREMREYVVLRQTIEALTAPRDALTN